VAVVDREEHEVLVVPAEGGILHAYVEPRDIYATDVLLTRELHETVDRVRQVVQVPGMVLVGGLVGMYDLLTFLAEAGANKFGL
jgi:hypothetical protein